tara:strand:- start:5535 stop:12839 length:7305 start_codon:yes stop_codon:yes gene_type:complete
MSDSSIFQIDDVVNLMKENHSLPRDFTGNEEEYYWNLASEKHPDLNLQSYNDVSFQPFEDYTGDYSKVDLTFDGVMDVFKRSDQFASDTLNKMKTKNAYGLSLNMSSEEEAEEYRESLQKKQGGSREDILGDMEKYQSGQQKYERPLFEGLLDPESWMYVENEGYRNQIVSGINNSMTGWLKNYHEGENLHPSWSQNKTIRFGGFETTESYDPQEASFGEKAVGMITQFSDPISLLSMGVIAKTSMTLSNPIAKTLWNKTIEKWTSGATTQFIKKAIPQSTAGTYIKDEAVKWTAGFGLKMAQGGFSLANITGSFGMMQSLAHQRMNVGKYAKNNGTINYTDTLNDTWKEYWKGGIVGALTTGVGLRLGITGLSANKELQMGVKNWSTFTKKFLGSKPTQIAGQATALTTAPMLLDKESRKRYYNSDGDFLYGTYATDVLFATGAIYAYWGLDAATARRPMKSYTNNPFVFQAGKKPPFGMKPVIHKGINKNKNNMANHIKNMKKDIVNDIKYETNKNLDVELNKPNVSKSIKNIKADLKSQNIEIPFEFFEKDVGLQTDNIETIQGLKSINDGLNQHLAILNKAGIKNDKGDYIGIDLSKITPEDSEFLLFVTPTLANAYQGYRISNYESDEAKNSYIERYEKTNNDGKKLTDEQRKYVLMAQENKINEYDLIKHDTNSWVTNGHTKSEQVIQNNPSILNIESQKTEDIIVVDEKGIPVDNTILTISKDDAKKGIEQGTFITVNEAKEKNLEVVEEQSNHHGKLLTEEGAKKIFGEALTEFQESQKPVSDNIPKNKSELAEYISESGLSPLVVKNKQDQIVKVSYDAAKELGVEENKVSAITNPYDIAILKSAKQGVKDFEKRIGNVNEILAHSKKSSITDLNSDDIRIYYENKIRENKKAIKKAKDEGKFTKLHSDGISPGTTSNVKIIFQNLVDKNLINSNPLTSAYQKDLTARYNETKVTVELPKISKWFSKVPNIYSKMKKDKNFNIGMTIVDNYTLRAEELNPVTLKHIKLHKSGYYYIDLTQKRSQGGIGKAKGVKRPLVISKEAAEALIKSAKGDVNKKLFPSFTTKLTQILKKEFPSTGGIDSKAVKRQMKTFAERMSFYGDQVGISLQDLTPAEKDIFNVISGHAEPKEASIISLYKDSANWEELFEMQENVLRKIRSNRDEYMKALNPMFMEKGFKGIVKWLENPKIGMSIEEVGGKSNDETINTIKGELNTTPVLSRQIKKKLVTAIRNQWNAFSEGMDKFEKKELMANLAASAGIDDYSNFRILLGTSSDELALFSDMIGSENITSKSSRMRYSKVARKVNETLDILRHNNYGDTRIKNFIKILFPRFKNMETKDISPFALTPEEASKFNLIVSSNPDLQNLPEESLIQKALISSHFNSISDKIGARKRTNIRLGFSGEFPTVIDYLLPRFPKHQRKALKGLAERVENHTSIEFGREGGQFRKWENDCYNAIWKDAEMRGKVITDLASPTTYIRRNKRRTKYGINVFNKMKNNFAIVIDKERYYSLVEEAKDPNNKLAKNLLKQVNDFKKKVWDGGKIINGKLQNEKLRKDTVESTIVKLYLKWSGGRKKSIENAIAFNKTDAEFAVFKRKNGIAWLNFHVNRVPTKEFLKIMDFGELKFENQIKKATEKELQILIDEFVEKTGKTRDKITDGEYTKLSANAEANALKALAEARNYNKQGFNARNLLKRGQYFGETVKVGNKYIQIYETDYDNVFPQYASGMAKTVANIEMLPEFVNIKGLSFKSSASTMKLIENLKRSGGFVGDYIVTMIEATTGMSANKPSEVTKVLQSLNTYIARTFLTTLLKGPVKNYMLAQGMNILQNDLRIVAANSARAFEWLVRQDLKETGYMQLSYTSIAPEKEINAISNIVDVIFNTTRFPSSEETGRAAAILATLQKLPMLITSLKSKNATEANLAKGELMGNFRVFNTPIKISKNLTIEEGEIGIIKKYGLSETEASPYIKGGGVPSRFKKVEFGDFDFPITIQERIKIQKIQDTIFAKILLNAHIKTSGSTIPINQPYWAAKYPILKAGALFQQLAISQTYNIVTLFKNNRKYKNNWRTLNHLGWSVGMTPYLLMAIHKLLNKADFGEMDEKFRTKLFRRMLLGEVGGAFSFINGLAIGEMPMSMPIVPFANLGAVVSILELMYDGFAAATTASGIKPHGLGDFSSWVIRNDIKFGGVDTFAKKMLGAYNNFESLKDWNKEFKNNQKQIDDNERSYYNDIRPHGKVKLLSTTITTGYYKHLNKQWYKVGDGIGKKIKKEDWDDFNESVLSVMQMLYSYNMSLPNMTPDEANKRVDNAIKQKLRSLHPILNGTGANDDNLLFSQRDEYFGYMKEKANRQNKPELVYVERLIKQEDEFNRRMSLWASQWHGWLNKQTSANKDPLLSHWKSIVKFNSKGQYVNPLWSKLGLKDGIDIGIYQY